jgi:hypothetical protein
MAASTVEPLSPTSQVSFIQYYNSITDGANTTRGTQRSRFEDVDKAYQRQQDLTKAQQRAKAANIAGDPNRFQNMTVPVVMPQVESAVTYQTSVFLTGSPLFGVVSSPQFIDQALALETIIEDNSIKGGWARELMMFFRDGYKYNFAPIEVDWNQEVTATVETNLAISQTEGILKEVLWSGNDITRWDPYNTFLDTSVHPTEVYRHGAFIGRVELMSRIRLKSFIAALPDKIIANVKTAFESSFKGSTLGGEQRGFYVPTINPDVNTDQLTGTDGNNWMKWASIPDTKVNAILYKDMYELTTLYCRVMPSEFGLNIPGKNTPQVFKLYIVNHDVVIYAERQTNAHGHLPVFIGQPLEDGLGYQTKSLADNAAPFQQLATSYMTSIISSRRRSITDRVLYDPSRITAAAINSTNPAAKIPVRAKAYNSKISDAVYSFPYKEDQAGNSMQQIQTLLGLANNLAGQNQASQGQFVKGNKTLSEFESVMDNANGRDQMASILLEFQVFVPMKHILKINTLQFQGGTTLYNNERQQQVEIDPIALRKAVLNFRISDGLIPSDKLLSTETFATAVQVMGSSPEIAAAYNMGQAFSYLMKTRGADLTPFEKGAEQQAFEQAMASWQSVAALLVEKGGDISQIPPMPLPADFGYDPSKNTPTPEEEEPTPDDRLAATQEDSVLNPPS